MWKEEGPRIWWGTVGRDEGGGSQVENSADGKPKTLSFKRRGTKGKGKVTRENNHP